MEHAHDGGRARRQQRAVRTRVGAAIATGIGFGAAVAAFAVHDHPTAATTVTSTARVTTPTTTAPTFDESPTVGDQQPDDWGATPGVGGGVANSTSHGS